MKVNRVLITCLIILLQSIFCFYLGIFKTDGILSPKPSVFLLLSCLILIVSIVNYKQAIILNTLEKIAIGFLLFLVIKNSFFADASIAAIGYLILPLLLYLSFKRISLNVTKHWQYYIGSVLLTLLLFLTFSVHHCYIKNENLDNFYIPNKTILGIVIAAQLCFLLPYFKLKFTTNKIVKYASALIILGSLVLLIATNSRSAWLGIVVAIGFVFYSNINKVKHKVFIKSGVAVVFIVLLIGLFFYKANSSNGRLLIYKVSTQIVKDNWLWGIGTGNFKTQYNNYQAQYFANHSIDSKEALLADNTYYAFNDYYQLIIENGVISIVFLIFFLVLLYKQIKKIAVSNNIFAQSAFCTTICILVAALFSYPLQFLPLTVMLLFCLAIINGAEQGKTVEIKNKYARAGVILLSALCLAHYTLYYTYQLQVNKASHLSKIGYKTKALQAYQVLTNYYFQDGNVLFNYAQELYYTNRLVEAKSVVEEAKQIHSSHELTKLSALINVELQNFVEAEKDFKTAIYMVPNRMLSRKELLDLYIAQKDTVNAMYWAKSILNMPVKVPSTITKNTQQRVMQILSEFGKQY